MDSSLVASLRSLSDRMPPELQRHERGAQERHDWFAAIFSNPAHILKASKIVIFCIDVSGSMSTSTVCVRQCVDAGVAGVLG